jgi:hypothetical protein
MLVRMILLAMLTIAAACGTAEGEQPGEQADPARESAGAAREMIQDDGFEMSWTVEGDSVTVTMSAPTTGWIAVGFHTEGAMKNAQIAIGYVQDGTVSLRDDFGTDYTSHAADNSLGGTDDLRVVSGQETGDRTVITFSMPLDSGDPKDRILVPGEACRAVLAYGNAGDDSFTGYHAWASTVDIEI